MFISPSNRPTSCTQLVRGSVCIPGFERANPPAAASEGGEEGGAAAERDRPPVYEEDYNYEKMEWKLLPDFVDRVRARDGTIYTVIDCAVVVRGHITIYQGSTLQVDIYIIVYLGITQQNHDK